MSVGLLIITHNQIGRQLLETATVMLETDADKSRPDFEL